MTALSRRSLLKSTATLAGGGLLCASSLADLLQAQTSSSPTGRIEPFPLKSVRLDAGIFRQQEEINARYLDSLPVDRLLLNFNTTAGIASSAAPYGGWEKPDCELRGHFAGGHYLSAAALTAASTGNTGLQQRGDQLVAGLAACQKKIGTGYLSAYPNTLFEHLVEGKEVWAPFYTYHKIMAGLVDSYVLTGNTDALQVAEGMARWTGDFWWGISDEQRQRMLRTEYGGMNEVLVNLAALTRKQQYLDIAHKFEQPVILDALAERRDDLKGMHANTNVPKIIGAARMYEVTGDRRYRQIAEYFLEEVLSARSYVIDNTSLNEHWTTAPDELGGSLGWSNAECCVAYNLMKLERLVFGWTGDARWMDAYERTLFNCRLGTQNPEGLKQYFFPLAAGYWRAFNSPEDSFWCCTGTGAEEFAKFSDTIYFRRGKDVYVNQFIPSTLTWNEEGFVLKQITKFPHEQGTTLKLTVERPAARTIHLRIPAWTTDRAEVKINGKLLDAIADPGSYLALRRVWQTGDTVALTLPMQLHQEPLRGDSTISAVLYGPLALATPLGEGPASGPARIISGRATEPASLPAQAPLPTSAAEPETPVTSWVEVSSAPELRFTATTGTSKLPLKPLYEITDERYSVYWQLKKPAKSFPL